MPTKRTKAPARRSTSKRSTPVPTKRVHEMLLELAYRLHATKPVATLTRATASVA
jgi:hypothetical protein